MCNEPKFPSYSKSTQISDIDFKEIETGILKFKKKKKRGRFWAKISANTQVTKVQKGIESEVTWDLSFHIYCSIFT